MTKIWNCVCKTCDQWFESDDPDDDMCPPCRGEWMNNYQEELSHEPPEEES